MRKLATPPSMKPIMTEPKKKLRVWKILFESYPRRRTSGSQLFVLALAND